MTRAALYLRVSTDKQTTDNQEQELRHACAARDWAIVKVFADQGISGAKTREKRPGLDELLKGATRREFDVIAVWSVDRLGRSLSGLVHTLEDVLAANVRLYIHQQAIDTGTPAGKALYGMLSVFAEFERAMIKERIRAGQARKGAGKPGRPRAWNEAQRRQVLDLRALGVSTGGIAAETGIPMRTVRRVIAEASEEK